MKSRRKSRRKSMGEAEKNWRAAAKGRGMSPEDIDKAWSEMERERGWRRHLPSFLKTEPSTFSTRETEQASRERGKAEKFWTR